MLLKKLQCNVWIRMSVYLVSVRTQEFRHVLLVFWMDDLFQLTCVSNVESVYRPGCWRLTDCRRLCKVYLVRTPPFNALLLSIGPHSGLDV